MPKKPLNNFLSDLTRFVRNNAPEIESGHARQSRKIYGQISYDTPIDAYRSVILYIEKGLGSYIDIISRVIYIITGFQNSHRQWGYFLHLFSFGWDDRVLHHKGHALTVTGFHGKGIARILCDLSGTDKPAASPVIPALFPRRVDFYSQDANVTKDDLLVFFCSDRSVKCNPPVRQQLSKQFQRRTVWIFLEGEMVDYEFPSTGRFLPEPV